MRRFIVSLTGVLCLLAGAWLWPQQQSQATPEPQRFEQWAREQDKQGAKPLRSLTPEERAKIRALLEDRAAPSKTIKTGKWPAKNKQQKGNQMADYIVSGAGTEGANGTYVEDGTLNGMPLYRKDANYTIEWRNYFGDDVWMIRENFGEAFTLYFRDSSSGAAAPDVGTWGTSSGSSPAPTVTESGGTIDTTKPTFSSASVPADGNSIAITLTEADSAPILPTTGVTGFSVLVNGKTLHIKSASAAGNVVTLVPRTYRIIVGESVSVSYSPGNVTDSATEPNAMEAFTAQSVTNNSTVQNNGSAIPLGRILGR